MHLTNKQTVAEVTWLQWLLLQTEVWRSDHNMSPGEKERAELLLLSHNYMFFLEIHKEVGSDNKQAFSTWPKNLPSSHRKKAHAAVFQGGSQLAKVLGLKSPQARRELSCMGVLSLQSLHPASAALRGSSNLQDWWSMLAILQHFIPAVTFQVLDHLRLSCSQSTG